MLFQADSEEKALAQATMAVLQGLELGIPPMQAVQQIAIIGGRCTIWGDLIPALIWRAGHKIREWIEGEGDARVAWCEITRGDNGEIIKRKFSVEDAKRAGLWDDTAEAQAEGQRPTPGAKKTMTVPGIDMTSACCKCGPGVLRPRRRA